MDEKSQDGYGLPDLDRRPSHRQRRPLTHLEAFTAALRDRSIRRMIVLLCLVTTAWVFVHRALVPSTNKSLADEAETTTPSDPSKLTPSTHPHGVYANITKVPLEAHIMSKCPDARTCIQQLVVPSMERISDKVDFQLSFIGKLDSGSDAVTCMHGPSECLGNIIMLCAQDLYPSAILNLGFANCMIGDYKKIPEREFVEGCALEHGLDFEKINTCISDDVGDGATLLRDSVERTAEAGVKYSCTVRVAEEEFCIVDGGKFKGCPDGAKGVQSLIEEVEEKWEKLNHVEE